MAFLPLTRAAGVVVVAIAADVATSGPGPVASDQWLWPVLLAGVAVLAAVPLILPVGCC